MSDLCDTLGWVKARTVRQLRHSFFSRRTSKNDYTVQHKTFAETKLANMYAEKAIILAECGLLVV